MRCSTRRFRRRSTSWRTSSAASSCSWGVVAGSASARPLDSSLSTMFVIVMTPARAYPRCARATASGRCVVSWFVTDSRHGAISMNRAIHTVVPQACLRQRQPRSASSAAELSKSHREITRCLPLTARAKQSTLFTEFLAAAGQHAGDAELAELIEDLGETSDEFRSRWATCDVGQSIAGPLKVRTRRVGVINLNVIELRISSQPVRGRCPRSC